MRGSREAIRRWCGVGGVHSDDMLLAAHDSERIHRGASTPRFFFASVPVAAKEFSDIPTIPMFFEREDRAISPPK